MGDGIEISNSEFKKAVRGAELYYKSQMKAGATSFGDDEISKSIFSQLDANNNGILEREEIYKAYELHYNLGEQNPEPSFFENVINNVANKFKGLTYVVFSGSKYGPEFNEERNSGASVNGKVDNNFKQGRIGDCWILASILAKISTPEGLKEVNDMLSVDEKGNVTVTIDNKKYTYTPEDLKEYPEYSFGDMDVRALELAIEEHWGKTIKQGGYVHNFDNFKALEGFDKSIAQDRLLTFPISLDEALDILAKNHDKSSGQSYSVVGAITGDPKGLEGINVINENGEKLPVVSPHAYAIIDYDDDYVYLNNPHSGTEKLKITHEDFRKAFTDFSYSKNGIKVFKMEMMKLDMPENTNPFS